MNVVSTCPLRVSSILWRPAESSWALTVVCKATYALAPGVSQLAPEQDDINERDLHRDGDERRSVHAPSDLAPFKVRADVLLVGHAFAPHRQPARSLVARLVAAGVDKSILVHADRAWTREGALHEGAPFTRMPLAWERAAGGPGTANPVGIRADAPPDARGHRSLPNLESPAAHAWETPAPIGFGPIASAWPDRAAMLHRHVTAWQDGRWNERVLPSDVDPRFFNAAPQDQQVDALRGDERIVLENLHRDHPVLVTSLSAATPRATMQREGGAGEDVALRCDTLLVDTDRGTCSLVWRGQIALWHAEEAGWVAVSLERRRAARLGTETIVGGKASPALPFARDEAREDRTMRLVLPAAPVATQEARPLATPDAARSAPAPGLGISLSTASPLLSDATTRIVLDLKPALPFTSTPSPAIAEASPAPPSDAPSDDETVATIAPPPMTDALPFVAHPPPTPPPPPMIGPLAGVPAPAPALIVPPPMLGPLAGLGPPAPEDPAPREVAAIIEAPAPLEIAPAVAPPPPEPVELTIEQFASISAEIAEKRAPRADVLRAHELTERSWAANERRWTQAIDDELANGKIELRSAGDRAYIAAVEGFRGPITLAEYTRIVVGLERGRANQALDELSIQRPALMRIIRLWTKKVAADAKLADDARRLLASMRA